jgi:hypothetical protein
MQIDPLVSVTALTILHTKRAVRLPGSRTRLGGKRGSPRQLLASTEGGFLGIGGVAVSDAEQATMAEISSATQTASLISNQQTRELRVG